jgi:hypothetical protein
MIKIRAAAITCGLADQRCTGAKVGKLQGGHCEQTNAVEFVDWAGGQGGGACHPGAPMLCRYAATSASLPSMAHLSTVQPSLQGR